MTSHLKLPVTAYICFWSCLTQESNDEKKMTSCMDVKSNMYVCIMYVHMHDYEAIEILKLAFARSCVLCSIFYRQFGFIVYITSDVPCRNVFLCGCLYVRLYQCCSQIVNLNTRFLPFFNRKTANLTH